MASCLQLCVRSLTKNTISVSKENASNYNYKNMASPWKNINFKAASQKGKSYMIPLVPPITLLIEDPISFTVSAASFRG